MNLVKLIVPTLCILLFHLFRKVCSEAPLYLQSSSNRLKKSIEENWDRKAHSHGLNNFFYSSNSDKNDSFNAVSVVQIPAHFKRLAEIDKNFAQCGKSVGNIRELDVAQTQKYFQTGKLSSVGLTICYLRRIEEMNPILKAVTQINPEAIKDALKLDLERSMGLKRSELHGIPVLLKDNIGTGDGMENTAGSLSLKGLKPKTDSEVVRKLRKAGAVILGKTNLSEFGYFRGTNVPSGWSEIGGQCLNPYNASVSPSGSSSGSAVAVAANLAMIALGTETDGSIAAPASKQSLFGLKPTKGLISTDGVFPLAFSQDNVGSLTRSASDAQIVLNVIAEEISQSRIPKKKCQKKEKCFLQKTTYRIGVIRQNFWNESSPILIQEINALESALETLENSGRVNLIDPVIPANNSFEKVDGDSEFVVFLHEFKHGINEYLSSKNLDKTDISSNISTLADIIAYNIQNNLTSEYNQELLISSEETDGIHNKTYLTLKEENLKGAQNFLDYLFDLYKVDALVGPSDEDLDLPLLFSMSAISGYPSLTVPIGFRNNGAPFGLTFVGKPYREKILLEISGMLDKKARKPPTFL